ncbi:MAG: LysM peptidoglycan-binding domain-containing protein [Bacteroidota bacterium]
MLQQKYNDALRLGEELGIKDGYVNEEEGVLKIGGMAKTQYEKDQIWDKIKKAGGDSPTDIVADITVETTDYYHIHTVVSGDSLSKIAKEYYGDPMKYTAIFDANTDVLKDPNVIHPGQELKLPNL